MIWKVASLNNKPFPNLQLLLADQTASFDFEDLFDFFRHSITEWNLNWRYQQIPSANPMMERSLPNTYFMDSSIDFTFFSGSRSDFRIGSTSFFLRNRTSAIFLTLLGSANESRHLRKPSFLRVSSCFILFDHFIFPPTIPKSATPSRATKPGSCTHTPAQDKGIFALGKLVESGSWSFARFHCKIWTTHSFDEA